MLWRFVSFLGSNVRLYGWIAAFLVGAGVVAGIWLHGNNHGKLACQAAQQEAIDNERARQSERADDVERAARARQADTQARVRTIYLEPDPAQCADAPALDSVLDALREGAD